METDGAAVRNVAEVFKSFHPVSKKMDAMTEQIEQQDWPSIECALCGTKSKDQRAFDAHLESCEPFKLSDGKVYPFDEIRFEMEPLLFGEARLIETDGSSVYRQWWFKSMEDAERNLQVAIHEGQEKFTGWTRAIIDPRLIKKEANE